MPALSLCRRGSIGAWVVDTSVTRVTGGSFNTVVNGKTTGAGGDYPSGIVGLAAGTWTFNPFSGLSGYTRAFDSSKPNNNWLTIVEADGPGTVTFNMAADSTGSFGGGTGGGFWVTGTGGSLRWCFNGQFGFNNGSIRFDASPAVDRIIWHNTSHTFPSSEYSRQVTGVGAGSMKGNDDPAAFRFHRNATRMYILRTLINDVCDDGVFIGNGSDIVYVIGAGISRIANHGVGSFHNDCVQITGGGHFQCFDSTLLTSSYQLVAESGQSITNMTVDRCWQGLSNSATLGALGLNGGTMGATNQMGQGAPTTRLSGHYLKSFGNGTNLHGDGAGAQVVRSTSPIGHESYVDYGSTSTVQNTGVYSVSVPSGVAGGLDSDQLPTNLETTINATLASSAVPHQLFRAAYSATDLAAVMSDYGIAYD